MSLRRASTAALLSDKVSRFAHLLQRDVRGNIADESPLVKAVLHEEEDEDGGSVSSNPESGIRELPRRRHSWDLADRDRESHFHFEYEDPSSGGIDVADINEGASAVPTSAGGSSSMYPSLPGVLRAIGAFKRMARRVKKKMSMKKARALAKRRRGSATLLKGARGLQIVKELQSINTEQVARAWKMFEQGKHLVSSDPTKRSVSVDYAHEARHRIKEKFENWRRRESNKTSDPVEGLIAPSKRGFRKGSKASPPLSTISPVTVKRAAEGTESPPPKEEQSMAGGGAVNGTADATPSPRGSEGSREEEGASPRAVLRPNRFTSIAVEEEEGDRDGSSPPGPGKKTLKSYLERARRARRAASEEGDELKVPGNSKPQKSNLSHLQGLASNLMALKQKKKASSKPVAPKMGAASPSPATKQQGKDKGNDNGKNKVKEQGKVKGMEKQIMPQKPSPPKEAPSQKASASKRANSPPGAQQPKPRVTPSTSPSKPTPPVPVNKGNSTDGAPSQRLPATPEEPPEASTNPRASTSAPAPQPAMEELEKTKEALRALKQHQKDLNQEWQEKLQAAEAQWANKLDAAVTRAEALEAASSKEAAKTATQKVNASTQASGHDEYALTLKASRERCAWLEGELEEARSRIGTLETEKKEQSLAITNAEDATLRSKQSTLNVLAEKEALQEELKELQLTVQGLHTQLEAKTKEVQDLTAVKFPMGADTLNDAVAAMEEALASAAAQTEESEKELEGLRARIITERIRFEGELVELEQKAESAERAAALWQAEAERRGEEIQSLQEERNNGASLAESMRRGGEAAEQRLNELEEELTASENTIAGLRRKLDDRDTENSILEAEVNALKGQIAEAQHSQTAAETRHKASLEAANTEIKELKQTILQFKREMKETYDSEAPMRREALAHREAAEQAASEARSLKLRLDTSMQDAEILANEAAQLRSDVEDRNRTIARLMSDKNSLQSVLEEREREVISLKRDVRLEIEKREMAEKEAEERVERLKNDNEVTIALLRSLQHIASDSLKVSSRFHRQAGSSRVEVEHLRAQMTSSLRCLPSKGDFERAWEYDTSAILRWNDGEEFVPGALLNLAADIDRAKNILTGALNDAAAVEVEDTEAHRVQVRKMEALFDQTNTLARTLWKDPGTSTSASGTVLHELLSDLQRGLTHSYRAAPSSGQRHQQERYPEYVKSISPVHPTEESKATSSPPPSSRPDWGMMGSPPVEYAEQGIEMRQPWSNNGLKAHAAYSAMLEDTDELLQPLTARPSPKQLRPLRSKQN